MQHIQKNLFSRKHNEVLDLNNLLASVYQVFYFFAPEAFTSSFVQMTAGRDSRGLKSVLHKHYALVNLSINLVTFYSLAVSLQIRQTREELARQPDLHHRVVFLQPPPSFDGGLDSQSLYLVVCFFNCPTKVIMLFLNNGESTCALFPITYKTPFSFSSWTDTTGCYMHQFLPLRKFLDEIFFMLFTVTLLDS